MPRFERKALVEKFQCMKRDRVPIIGGGAGIGLSAKCEEAGGIDLIVIYNSGRFRMAGRGSAAGLLAITLSKAEPWVVMWFRSEHLETLNWAGNPHEKRAGPDGMLTAAAADPGLAGHG